MGTGSPRAGKLAIHENDGAGLDRTWTQVIFGHDPSGHGFQSPTLLRIEELTWIHRGRG
jgi:hypothetical protein